MPRTGPIQEDGTYRVTGIPVGAAKIGVSTIDPKSTEDLVGGESINLKTGNGPAPALLPKPTINKPEYLRIMVDPDKSGLGLTVKTGANDYNIELKK
jgi:hypothetical protein